MMRVGICYSSFARELGGGSRFESEVTLGLANQANDQFEFHLISDKPNPRFEIPNIEIPHAQLMTRRRLIAEKLRLVGPLETQSSVTNRTLKQQGIDLLYSPHPGTVSLDMPYVVTCWDLQHRMQPFFPEVSTVGWDWDSRELTYQRVLRRAAAVVTGTEQGKKEIELFFGVHPDRISVIPFAVSSDLLQCVAVKPKWAPNNRFVVYPSQFWPHKNHVTIVLALRALKQNFGLDITAVFPGSANLDASCTREYVESMARDAGVSVVFPGFIQDEELRWLYENGEALVFASLFGPDNLPPIEAMSLKCPVVASNVPGAEEQLGDTALLVTPTDELAMASAIHQVMSNTETRRGLIERGTCLTNRLSMKRYTSDLLSLFGHLAKYRRCWPSQRKSSTGTLCNHVS
ncbi:D-inositol-3-phosphate glycosyltransferase [Novipirellula aureliae]|uniref:D-inositol-3-phosphate glycosyltransferase n=1 Tax=Novipirellula aureliae TaxID=2527966 RepID=A0A5C6E0L5_9BACT|nr:glycosyltransferase family 1 protein [Novipirellula aureliae]TWU41191.1 D-inositol-3-phosphate glycosyltransferase [Novipirellula aureliae]